MNKVAIIARGCPGSGKSTTVQRLRHEFAGRGKSVEVCSSDYFFECGACGHYDFRRELLGIAHKQCQEKFVVALKAGVDVVFVDNTNVTVRECYPYVRAAADHGYEIRFVEPQTPWAFDLDELVKRNQHDVPRHAIERMLRRWVPNLTVEKVLAGEMTADEAAATAAQGV
jgi:tRNA uridine 5-carbamoylmethylation protein Kti12